MSTATEPRVATLADLARHDGKAELIAGRIVSLLPTGRRPSRVAARISKSLDAHAEAVGRGEADTDNMGFAVRGLVSGRESFSPDAADYVGPLPGDEDDFIAGPPTLAVEVRSKSDQGPAAELEIAAKRADYFEAGTLVVWDVDPRMRIIRSYRSDAPTQPVLLVDGQIAEAEPTVPGWRVAVDDLWA